MGFKQKIRIAAVVILLMGALVARVLFVSASVTPLAKAERAKADAIKRLAQASSLADLKSAVGGLGCVYVYPDKSWVAIWYNAFEVEHAKPGENQARCVALDSKGEWFECNEGYVDFRLQPKLDADYDEFFAKYGDKKSPDYHWSAARDLKYEHFWYVLTTSPSLDKAKIELLANGFTPFDPGVKNLAASITVTDADVTTPKDSAQTQATSPSP